MIEENKILVIAHSKGGSKKSTSAWHLANALRQKKYSSKHNIIIVDTDIQQTLTIVNSIRESQTKLPVFKVLQPISVSELLEIFETYKNEIIVVDTGGFDKDINRVAIAKADKVIVPLMASIHDVLGLTMFTSILNEIGKDININVLLVGVHHKTTNFQKIEEIIQDNPNAKLLKSKILSKNANFKSMETGLSVYDIDAEVELRKRYDGVIDELINT